MFHQLWSGPGPLTKPHRAAIAAKRRLLQSGLCCGALLPVVLDHFSLPEQNRLRRLDIAALGALLVCNAIMGFIWILQRRKARSLPWTTWNGAPLASKDQREDNRALLQWGVLVGAGLMGAGYSWITGRWIILPIFLIAGYWIGLRARKMLHQ